ncbi:MAG: response regulator [Microthrixaceae bacterium]
MTEILLATDSESIRDAVEAAIASADTTVLTVTSGPEVRAAALDLDPALIVLDLQLGAMGGIGTCIDLRAEEGAGRLPPQNILLLLDREPDLFLARRSGADGWLVKPLDPRRLADASEALIAGGSYKETAKTPTVTTADVG